jgi:hypothetical protein
VVLLDQLIQIFRRAQLRFCSKQAIGFQLAHPTVRCSVAVERDRLWAATLVLNRFPKECFGGGDVAPGTQPPLSDPLTDLQVRCHGSQRDGRDVPEADMYAPCRPRHCPVD